MSYGHYIKCDRCAHREDGYREDDGWGPPGWMVIGFVTDKGGLDNIKHYCPGCIPESQIEAVLTVEINEDTPRRKPSASLQSNCSQEVQSELQSKEAKRFKSGTAYE